MTRIVRALEPAPGVKSRLVGLFLWQLDDQSRQLLEATRGATPQELAWQPGLGMNTIGMLLAHIAVVEASWIGRALHGLDDLAAGVLPIGRSETGVPLAEGAPAPAFLNGKDLAFFDDLLARSRAHTKREASPLADSELDRRFLRRHPDGTEFECSVGWMLYHILEHEAGHHYQINRLRHQYRIQQVAA
jgi:uncharacterized damage-inducible protein DinB